jgi:hypothetical protein
VRIPALVILALSPVLGQPAIADEFARPTNLVEAAKRGDDHAVRSLLAENPDLDARGPIGYTALHWACIREHWRIAAVLVAAGAPVNAAGTDGGTPLHWACHHDQPDAVRLLLGAGADPTIHNQWGRTPLHVAARRNCPRVAEILLDSGADPNATTTEGWTPLHVASRSGHVEMVDLLTAGGADPNLIDTAGLTPVQSWRRRPDPIAIDPTALDSYVGIYDLGPGASVKVWREAETLRLREFAADDLYPIGIDRFGCRQEPWEVRFVRGDDGLVATIEIDFLRRTVRGAKTAAPLYVGSRTCMGCHTGAEEGSQDLLWLQSRHAHAFWRLGADWALFLARLRPHNRDLETPMSDDRCLLCHVTGAQNPEALFATSFRPQEGVSCEACHGPGSEYSTLEVMGDREEFFALGGRIPGEATCRGCHRNPDNFDWAGWLPKIAHPRPNAPPGDATPSDPG